ncbi:lytic transglycosylase domain-containing protein [Streptacidiphilus pinicola]|uniref:Lytic transglycosylase domain-containing protein n=1 Tax=Streptacidiphilus pinicola TaxID=2219663 RepID=A0A2X0IHY4_9ACTN|nr:transglycosylase SLT domain-containing protein [Streptacidiphilus pinicola]RAG84177.1 lytic transglycosylase domain-containing protein [Streptacidiphilus pinicola]
MNRISVRGMAVASATAVTAVGAVVGVASGEEKPTQVADVAGSTLLAEVPAGSSAQVVADNLTRQSDAQQSAAVATAQKQAAQAARAKAADAARAKAAAEQRAKDQAAAAASREAAAQQQRQQLVSYSPGSVQALAASIIGNATQFSCFSQIVTRESGWNYQAVNAGSGAYGLVQALPGDKMASAGSDWRTNPATQIRWGLNYMNSRYGSPCGAWSFWQAHSWY